jgi:hypothetical protein
MSATLIKNRAELNMLDKSSGTSRIAAREKLSQFKESHIVSKNAGRREGQSHPAFF